MTDTHNTHTLPHPTGTPVVPEPPVNRFEAERLDRLSMNHYPTHVLRMDAAMVELQELYAAQGDTVRADLKARELVARVSAIAPNLLRYLIATDGR